MGRTVLSAACAACAIIFPAEAGDACTPSDVTRGYDSFDFCLSSRVYHKMHDMNVNLSRLFELEPERLSSKCECMQARPLEAHKSVVLARPYVQQRDTMSMLYAQALVIGLANTSCCFAQKQVVFAANVDFQQYTTDKSVQAYRDSFEQPRLCIRGLCVPVDGCKLHCADASAAASVNVPLLSGVLFSALVHSAARARWNG